jgi:hypothetical protein
MKNQVVGPVVRPIKVQLAASVLTPPQQAAAPATPAPTPSLPPDAIIALQVEFEGQTKTADFETGQTVDASGLLNQVVNLSVPIEQFVLHEGNTDTYRYRVILINPHGKKTGDWTASSVDTLFVTVD